MTDKTDLWNIEKKRWKKEGKVLRCQDFCFLHFLPVIVIQSVILEANPSRPALKIAVIAAYRGPVGRAVISAARNCLHTLC